MLIIIVLFAFCNSMESFAFDYVINDFNFYPILNTPRPPKGVTFQDPIFYTNITRITDAPKDIPGGNYIFPGYPKHDMENADGTKLVLQSMKYPGWHIWNANPPYNKIKDIPPSLTQDIDPDVRWDATDPNILYSTFTSKMYKYNVVTDQITLLHDFQADFPDKPIARVFTAEEGDSSGNSRYWFFKVRCFNTSHNPTWWDTAVIVYDKDYYGKDNGKIISTLNEGTPLFYQALNYTDISFDGNWAFCTEPGLIYPRDLSSRATVPIAGHADRAISREGKQVIFGGNQRWSGDGYTDMGPWTMMFDMETKAVTWLAKMGKGAGVYHISCNSLNTPGWGLVSVYGPSYPATPTSWDEHSIYMVELTTRKDPPPRVWRVAHTHTVRKDYGDDSFAKINKRGTKIWFGSGWGQSHLDPGAQYDVYQIDLPSTWYKDLMGYIPPTASITATPLSGKPPLTVNFMGSGKGDGTVVSYTWNFGDGATSNQQNVSHTYESPGGYTATLRVIDDKGAGGSANTTINVLKSDTTPPAPPKGVKTIK
jgi:PKD repeat protein